MLTRTYVSQGASSEYPQHMFWRAILMSTHNICYHEEIRKLLSGHPSYRYGAMNKNLEEG